MVVFLLQKLIKFILRKMEQNVLLKLLQPEVEARILMLRIRQ